MDALTRSGDSIKKFRFKRIIMLQEILVHVGYENK